jgi:tetratricopeptide (TPR) repeat protein
MNKLQITFIITLNSLFLNNVYAESQGAEACNKAYYQGDVINAISLANQALSHHKSDKDALVCQGRALSAKGDLDAALSAFKEAEQLSTDALDKLLISVFTGQAYKAAKQYEQAISSYQSSLQQARIAKFVAYERASQHAIGDVYFALNQFDDALVAYLAASKLDANDNERAESYEKTALTYHTTNQHDLALEYQLKAYFMYGKSGTLDQYAEASIELGRYYAIVKNYVRAENILNKLIDFAKEQGGAYFEAKGSYVLAQVKVSAGDQSAAKALVEHAKSIAKATNDKALDEEITQHTQHLF